MAQALTGHIGETFYRAFHTDKIKYTPAILWGMSRAYMLKDDCLIIHRDLTKLDYVELFARAIRTNNSLFKQQKMLIESQLHSSASFFGNNFGKHNFEKEAREYLMKIGLL